MSTTERTDFSSEIFPPLAATTFTPVGSRRTAPAPGAGISAGMTPVPPPPTPTFVPSTVPGAPPHLVQPVLRNIHRTKTYDVRKDISPLYYLNPDSRKSTLTQFLILVQGRSMFPMNQLVNDWDLVDGVLTMEKLSPVFQAALAAALTDLIEDCRMHNKAYVSETDIIDDPTHPYYFPFVDLMAAHIVYTATNNIRSVHSLRDNYKKLYQLSVARGVMQRAVLRL